MASRKSLVDQAIRFDSPARVPIVFWNCDQTAGDVLLYHLSLGVPGDGNALANVWDWSTNEWGYHLESMSDGTMGHPVDPLWRELPTVDQVQVPALRERERMHAVAAFVEQCEDRYRLASLDLSGFTIYTFLRGFENAMQDFLIAPDQFGPLMDLIMDFECELMTLAARHQFHGIHFADDWATQHGMIIAPSMWRELFKPRYRRQFEHAHRLGLDVWFHCCGNLADIADDFHEIGVDVLNISQPNVVDLPRVGGQLRGKQCFMMPISYQTVSISGTVDEILAEAERMFRLLAVPSGGFIGYVEEYGCMGMSPQNYRACGQAFRRLEPQMLAEATTG